MRRSGLPELERLAGTIEAWWPEVLGFLQTGVTNAGTEATNHTVSAARELYDTIAGARLAVVPNASHLSPLEQPEAVTAHVTGFLAGTY